MSSSGLGQQTILFNPVIMFLFYLFYSFVLFDLFCILSSVVCSCALLKFNSASDSTKVVSSLKTIRDDLSVRLLQPHEQIR